MRAPDAGIEVLEIASARYQSPGSPARSDEASICHAWALDAVEAEAFFKLSRPLADGELHAFDWLPCTITGRLRAEGRDWAFEINAAGTSIWRSASETRLLGCADSGCEPFVILMPDTLQD